MARTIAKDYDQKRMHILKVSARVFATDGFARASMSQVAQACNISKANIYHYYDSKDALLFDILDTYLRDLRDQLSGLPLDGAPPEQQLGLFVAQALIAYDGMDAEHKIQIEGLPLLSPEQQTLLRGYQREMVEILNGIVARIGQPRFDNDPASLRNTTMSIFGMLNWYFMWNRNADGDARRAYADHVTRLVIGGIKGL